MQLGSNNYFFGNYIQRYGCIYCKCTRISFKLSALGFGSNGLATERVLLELNNSIFS